MMPCDKKFRTKDLSAQINSAGLSFAGDEYMEKFLDIFLKEVGHEPVIVKLDKY